MRIGLVALIGSIAILGAPMVSFAQSDSSSTTQPDSSVYDPEAIAKGQKQIGDYLANHFGFDLFVTGELYTFHFRRAGFFSMSGGAGVGAEIRLAPIFIGGITGESGNEIPRQPSGFYYSSFYGGFMIARYRVEVGEVYGETSSWSTRPPPLAVYKSYFAGVGRRFGSGFFFEPEMKVMLPVISTFYYSENIPGSYGYPGYNTSVGLNNGGLRDMFFALTVKVGMCMGSDH